MKASTGGSHGSCRSVGWSGAGPKSERELPADTTPASVPNLPSSIDVTGSIVSLLQGASPVQHATFRPVGDAYWELRSSQCELDHTSENSSSKPSCSAPIEWTSALSSCR